MKKIIICLLSLFLLSGCKPNYDNKKLSISPINGILKVGETLQLEGGLNKDDGINYEGVDIGIQIEKKLTNLKWSSSDESIASVSSKGVVTAKKVGETTITATTAEGYLKSETLIITYDDSATLNVEDNYTCKVGKSFDLAVRVSGSKYLSLYGIGSVPIDENFISIEKIKSSRDCPECYTIRINCLKKGETYFYVSSELGIVEKPKVTIK